MEGRDPRTHRYEPLPHEPTDLDRLGGEAFLDTIVSTLHERIAADSVLSAFFIRSSPERAMAMEREYVAVSLGGKGRLAPSSVREVHEGRGISDAHFRRFLDLYIETLRYHDVDEHIIDHAIDRLAIASTDVLDAAIEVG
jgi:hemoglobin